MKHILPIDLARLKELLPYLADNIRHPGKHSKYVTSTDDLEDEAAYLPRPFQEWVRGIKYLVPFALLELGILLREKKSVTAEEWQDMLRQSWLNGISYRFGEIKSDPRDVVNEILKLDEHYYTICNELADFVRLQFSQAEIQALTNEMNTEAANDNTSPEMKRACLLLNGKLKEINSYPVPLRRLKRLIHTAWQEASGETGRAPWKIHSLKDHPFEATIFRHIAAQKHLSVACIWRGYDATYLPGTPEENYEILKQCESPKDVYAFLKRISKKEWAELHSVMEDLKLGQLCFPYNDPLQFTILSGSDWDIRKEFSSPTQSFIDRLYTSMFHLVKAAQEKAHKNGKTLMIIAGDFHHERTDLMALSMLLHICKRLEFNQVGIEVSKKGEMHEAKYFTGRMSGMEMLRKRHKVEMPLEKDGPCHMGATRNFDFLEWLARVRLKMKTFAADPKSFLPHQEEHTHENLHDNREEPMHHCLIQKQREDCICFVGSFHLQALSRPYRLSEKLIFSATNGFYNGVESSPQPYYRNYTLLPMDAKQAARLGGSEKRKDNPMIQAFVEGHVCSADIALKLAEEADKRVGEKLAPLAKMPPKDDYFERIIRRRHCEVFIR